MMNLDGLMPWGGLAGAPFDAADMVVAGIPYDGSAVYRKGAALAPQRIRSLSAAMPPSPRTARYCRDFECTTWATLTRVLKSPRAG